MAQAGNHADALEPELIRHMVLNTIRSLRTKFASKYGELVIAADDKKYWRREVFQHYKANRKADREKSNIDWNSIFNTLNDIREELKEYFPYRVIRVEGAEADDVIATLVFKYGVWLNNEDTEKILILSGDKDFIQLQIYSNVEQFDMIRKRAIKHDDPATYIKEHVIKGDRGDGIPNILSPDDCLVRGERQSKMTEQRMAHYLNTPIDEYSEKDKRNYYRNQQLIDLSQSPKALQETIVAEYEAQANKTRNKMFNYFVKHKLKNLMESISEF